MTGQVGNINHTEYGTMVEFVNDFGTPYFLHPALIKGFVYQDGPIMQMFESKFWHNRWMFLRVILPGDNLRLLQAPEEVTSYEIINGRLTSQTQSVNEYWLEIPGKRIFPVKRMGFKRKMRRLVNDVSPTLADKIGSQGYRYRDLYRIVQEYNQQCELGIRRL